MPTLTQLEYIVKVDELKNFNQAAIACHVSQPTLSMQIQKAEEEIGFLIFDRMKKPIMTTEKGQQYITQARVVLKENQKLQSISTNQLGVVSGNFSLAIIPTIAPYLIPLFISSISKKYPLVNLTIQEMKTEDIIHSLKNDKIDGGILATPIGIESLYEKVLYYEPFQIFISPKHELAQSSEIDLKKIQNNFQKDLWLLQDGHCFRNQIMNICGIDKNSGVLENIRFEGGQLETLKNLIINSGGFTFVPELFTHYLSKSEKEKYCRKLSKQQPVREVSLMVRRDQWKEDIIRVLSQEIRECLPKEIVDIKNPRQVVGVI